MMESVAVAESASCTLNTDGATEVASVTVDNSKMLEMYNAPKIHPLLLLTLVELLPAYHVLDGVAELSVMDM